MLLYCLLYTPVCTVLWGSREKFEAGEMVGVRARERIIGVCVQLVAFAGPLSCSAIVRKPKFNPEDTLYCVL